MKYILFFSALLILLLSSCSNSGGEQMKYHNSQSQDFPDEIIPLEKKMLDRFAVDVEGDFIRIWRVGQFLGTSSMLEVRLSTSETYYYQFDDLHGSKGLGQYNSELSNLLIRRIDRELEEDIDKVLSALKETSNLNKDNVKPITGRYYLIEYFKDNRLSNHILIEEPTSADVNLLDILRKVSAIELYNVEIFSSGEMSFSGQVVDSLADNGDFIIPSEELVWIPKK